MKECRRVLKRGERNVTNQKKMECLEVRLSHVGGGVDALSGSGRFVMEFSWLCSRNRLACARVPCLEYRLSVVQLC